MKRETGEKGLSKESIRVLVNKNTPIYHYFNKFMRNDKNKTELFILFSEELTNIQSSKIIVCTHFDRVLSNKNNLDTTNLVLMYDRTSGLDDVNQCWKYLFTKRGRSIENCSLTKDALLQHANRAKLVSNIWSKCMDAIHAEPDYNEWGWVFNGQTLKHGKACKELVSVSCKKQCIRCKCVVAGLPCTELCVCSGGCDRS